MSSSLRKTGIYFYCHLKIPSVSIDSTLYLPDILLGIFICLPIGSGCVTSLCVLLEEYHYFTYIYGMFCMNIELVGWLLVVDLMEQWVYFSIFLNSIPVSMNLPEQFEYRNVEAHSCPASSLEFTGTKQIGSSLTSVLSMAFSIVCSSTP